MIQIQWFQRKLNAALVIAVSIAGFFGDPLSLLAAPQNALGVSTEPRLIQFALNNLKNPPNRGTPRGTVGTGSRGDCLNTTKPVTLLAGEPGLEQTVSGHPTFWVYVPYAPDATTWGEFSLQEGEEEVYRAPFQLPPSPGIVGIVLPGSVAPLQPGKEYRWYVDINCPRRKSSRNSSSVSVTGIVKPVAIPATLVEDLGNAKTPLQRAASYARHGLWFDTVTELAHLRLNQPHNSEARQAWIELFRDRSDGLKRIADEAITGRVITSSPPK